MNKEDILIAYKEGKISIIDAKNYLLELKKEINNNPLSEGQKGLWMLHHIDPDMHAYNIPLCFHINQMINIDILKRTCSFIVKQYPILNTVIRDENGIPYQKINENQKIDFRYEDISEVNKNDIILYLREKAKDPFSLEKGPLMRIILLSKSKYENYLLIIIHHIVFDGRSCINKWDTFFKT